ncbi:uncharacterized protein LOC124653568 isoform X2 [Lolium rigidum]|uniref:uncharacterized protein LOC124653568 isoform X2 n=1 Tax=Lolium rigidum TaxID=89674 RepID=UPI001F5D3400|nr:uncharacterized protein LOC124653568 isoform X2 [Lolium rigidum]
MELEEGNPEAQQSGTSILISGATRTGPVLSPLINRSRAYVEDDADEQDVDYGEEEEDEDDDDEDEAEEDFPDEEEGDEDVDMGTFSEQGRNFLSKVWREYEPKRVDGIVIAAECKHCARNICAERKHGTSSLRKHLKRCKERKKILIVSGQLSARPLAQSKRYTPVVEVDPLHPFDEMPSRGTVAGRSRTSGLSGSRRMAAAKPCEACTGHLGKLASPPHDGWMTAKNPLDLDDLLLEIISRVPARERWRFKQVCKRWLCLARKLPQSLAGFFYTSHNVERFPKSALHFFNISSTCPEPPRFYPSFDFLPDHRKLDLLDCCNGLLLCRWWGTSVQYIVCNPATKEWVMLPYSGCAADELILPRLGFDPLESSHFHVFFLLGDMFSISGVLLYSSETRGWVRKENGWDQEVRHVGGRPKTVFLKGYMHFHLDAIVHLDSKHYRSVPCLAAVATNGETWTIVNLPPSDDDDDDEGFCFGFIQLSQGSLHYVRFEGNELAVYVLEDYGSKQFKLKHRAPIRDLFSEDDFPELELSLMTFEWVAIHPECDVIFFTIDPDKCFMCYKMDLQKVTHIRFLTEDGKPPYLPYAPLYAELQSLRVISTELNFCCSMCLNFH